jgi:hypothetical protein
VCVDIGQPADIGGDCEIGLVERTLYSIAETIKDIFIQIKIEKITNS